MVKFQIYEVLPVSKELKLLPWNPNPVQCKGTARNKEMSQEGQALGNMYRWVIYEGIYG